MSDQPQSGSEPGAAGAAPDVAGSGPPPAARAEHWPAEVLEHRHIGEGGSPHGKPSSWVLVAVIIAAFAGGGLALIIQSWTLFFVCVGIVGLSIPAGKLIGIMNDTVSWGSSPGADDDRS
jgi:hypothetical protein